MTISVIRHDDSSLTVRLPAFEFEIPGPIDSSEALIEKIVERTHEVLEDHFEASARFITDGSEPAPKVATGSASDPGIAAGIAGALEMFGIRR
ncbi:hypothetical protein XH83_15350 [Bradyrhizobium sp. CCBAU 53351]|uniref:hypothetical protein n=1 Tax=Bradyrhizobium sp. CCBAU 53351 TaxID=1325114 RepID=UPI0018892ABD|nr:hypothetical protein [Bradyrhizobium sp. CCBAU 53351]QOZ76707.1 hypothetical protein XH83_15350 [Bradyrhizobium sp. CCBAU 53351]